jgi:hypothetical protein
MKKPSRKITNMPVMKQPCLSCPFEGKKPVDLTDCEKMRVFADVKDLKGQHLCHSVHDQMICRGGRNLLFKYLVEKGLLVNGTDEEFERKSKQLLGNNYEKSFSKRRGL